MSYTLGQFLGILSTVGCIVMPLYKKKWQMTVNTLVVNLLMAFNFILIGQFGSAIFLYLVACVQTIVSLIHTQRDTEVTLAEKVIFLFLYVGLGIFGIITAPGFEWVLNFRNILEILPIIGSILSMIFVFVKDEKVARRYLLATSSIWCFYTAMVGSSVFFAQLVSLITTLIAIYKYRNHKVSE